MDTESKKCKKCGSEDLFQDKQKKETEGVRCLLCGLTGSIDDFRDEKKDKEKNTKV